VIFEVGDTGIGIAPEHQARIFDRFWQVDSASTRSFGGLGIGLAAAREFSRLLGGDVGVESEVGKGSTFRVWLPRPGTDGEADGGRRTERSPETMRDL
jgi:signal transduction histidine kinase